MHYVETAGFIGLGAMGYPMAHHLRSANHLKSVFNRTPARAEQFALEHPAIQIAESPAQLAMAVDLIFVCVSQDADVIELIDAMLPVIREGQIVIDCSTVSRETAIDVAQKLATRGAHFADAPVTGGVEGAKNGTLSVMVGGDCTILPRIIPFLETYSSRIIHMGEIGSGQSAKAVNQVMCAGINEAVTEALGFGVALGLDIERVIEAIRGGAAGNWFLDKRGSTMTQGQFHPGFKLALHQKDLRICLEMARKIEQPLPLTKMTSTHYETLIAEGYGSEDISSLYRLKRPTH